MMKKPYQDTSEVSLHLFFITAIAIIILSAFILAFFYSKFAHPPVLDASIFVHWARAHLMPEPQERFVFMVLALMVPMGAFLTALTVFRGINKQEKLAKQPSGRVARIIGILVFSTAALLYFPFIGFDFSQALLTGQPLPSEHPVFVLVMTLLVAAGWCVWQLYSAGRSTARLGRVSVMVSWTGADRFLSARYGRVSGIVSWVMFSTAVLLTCAWRMRNELSISQAWAWYGHAETILYPLGQVMIGKTLLFDLPSQYGLFPELLMPIFKLIGLSILSFSAVCALLQILSLGAVYWVVHRSVRDTVIRITVGLALVMVTFWTPVWLIGIPDPCYQYWPIRFFWPAMAVLLFYRFSNKPTPWRAFSVSLVGAVGAIWNMDSGLMIVLAFAGVLVAKWVVLWLAGRHAYMAERRILRNALLIHIATFVIAWLWMFGYLCVKGGGPLHWDWLYGSQKLFYGLGFYMLPMPLHPSPWMSVLGIYLIALIVAARTWALFPHAKRADLLTFLSLLGLGLFMYYQGRSHILNLITTSWPALVLIALLADRVLRAVRTGLLSWQHLMLPIAGLSILLFCSIPLVFSVGKPGEHAITANKNRNIPADELVRDELSFIRMNTSPGDECLILSRREGVYYAVTGIASPISGPGSRELVLQRDLDVFLDKLTLKRYACIFVGVGNLSTPDLGVDLMTLLQGYDIAARNQHGSMLYLQPQAVPSTQGIINRSAIYLHDNKVNHAISLLKEAMINYPRSADLYNNLCVAYGLKKNFTDAISACLSAVQIAPDYQLAKNNLAWVEHEKQAQG